MSGILSYAQISIGKSEVTNQSTLVDFNETNNKLGIILPSIEASSNLTDASNGTFIFDKNDKKIKMKENNIWINLSDIGNTDQLVSNNSSEPGEGVIIGAESSNAPGVLVLEATNKAMVLPKIANPHINVASPYPGMICYDTVSKSLAVFDGIYWSYWKQKTN